MYSLGRLSMLPAAPSAMATARNMPFRVAARLPERDAACATGGGRPAACAGCISSFSTRRRSAAIIISICLDSRHWLWLLVCVLVQVIYGVSAVSGHFGDVFLWKLNPPAAGEVLVSAGGHPRLLCEIMTVRMHYNAQQHFVHVYHHSRSDLDTGADGCAEGDGSRPCAGGGVILWERALLAWGMEMSLGEPASTVHARERRERGT